jgi:hypothetical protein
MFTMALGYRSVGLRELLGDDMSSVMILCPATGSAAYTGIETDSTTLARLPDLTFRMFCSVCDATHLSTSRNAWLDDTGWQKGLRKLKHLFA